MLNEFMYNKVRTIYDEVGYDIFPIEKYYNRKDKKILMKINPEGAKLIWDNMKNNIYRYFQDGLSCWVCPFCSIYRCENCEYAKHHKNLICDNFGSELKTIINLTIKRSGKHISDILTNEKYCEIIERVEEKYEKIFGNESKEKRDNNNNEVKLKIECHYDNKRNKCDTMWTHNLYEVYDFTSSDFSGDIIIWEHEIEDLMNQKFSNINEDIVHKIFYLAENCKIDTSIINSHTHNFAVSSDGEIRIGNNMIKIKENLEEIKRAYKEWKDKSKRANVIKISFE